MMMKNLIRSFLIISACIMLSGCSNIGTFEDGNVDNETFTVVEDNMINDMPDEDKLDAIFYNGVCYYGLAMGTIIEVGEEPEGFTYLGKISSVKERYSYESPTEELETTVFEVGEDVYYYVDEDGRHNFCIPTGGVNYIHYKGIYRATTQKPTYYDE